MTVCFGVDMEGGSAHIGGSYVEGFGDDFVEAGFIVLLLLSPVVAYLIYWR